MITITIKQSGSTKTTVRENSITKSTPTDKYEDSDYGNKKKAVCIQEFAVIEVEKVKDWTVTLLEQNVLDDAQIDLLAVIKAINKM
jgi:hypothetical protein